MAKKTRRQAQKARPQNVGVRSQPAVRTEVGGGSAPITAELDERIASPELPPVTAQKPVPRATIRPITKLPNNVASLIEALPADDAAIPLDRVPYVVSDLKRVAVVALCMLVFIIIAGLITVHLTNTG